MHLGAFIKDVRIKSQKKLTLFPYCPHCLNSPPLSVWTHHILNLTFLYQKVQTSASEETPFPLVRTGQTPTSECGRLL